MFMSYFENEESFTNDLTGRSRDEIILDFAYSLVTAGKDASNAFIKEAMLKMWRQNQHLMEELPEKKVRKYNFRRLSDDNDLSRVASALKFMTENEEERCDISFGIILGMSRHVVKVMNKKDIQKFDGAGPAAFESAYRAFFDKNTSKDFHRFRYDWASAAAYARTFLKKEEFFPVLDSTDMSKEDPLVKRTMALLGEAVFCTDDSFLWFPDTSNLKEDKRGIAKYSLDSDYFRQCISDAHTRLLYIRDTFMFATGLPGYGAYSGYVLSCLYDDCDAMREAGETLLKGEMKTSPLAAEKPKKLMRAPSDKNYMNFWFAKGALKCIYENTRCGIDIMTAARDANLSKRDTELVVKEAFGLYELWLGETCSFTSKKDKEAVSEIIVRLWLGRCLEKQLTKLNRGSRVVPEKGSSNDLKNIINDYEEKNAVLERKLAAAEQKIRSSEAAASGEAKALRAEIVRLKDAVSKKEAEIRERDAEKEELLELFMLSDGQTETGQDEEGAAFTEEEFRTYINEHKVLVWGLREETERRFQEMFPELTFVESDRRLTRQQLEAYDVLIMATHYTNHGNFWAARDTAKASGIPMVYLEKTANNPESLYRALDIAVGEGAGKLHR